MQQPWDPSQPIRVLRRSPVLYLLNPLWWLIWIATAGIGLLVWFVLWRRDSLLIYADRIVHRQGFLTVRERIIPIYRIQDVTMTRQLGFGRIVIETAGEQNPEQFGWITDAPAVRDLIYRLMTEAQRR
jgi:membrane protein YdbS with pleckstrin-like domain